jgi:hypothetical protein
MVGDRTACKIDLRRGYWNIKYEKDMACNCKICNDTIKEVKGESNAQDSW